MSETEPHLDESLRRKLLALGEQVEAPLEAESERRILGQLQLETQRRASRDKVRRRIVALGVFAAAAAMALTWLGRTTSEPVASVTTREAPTCPWANTPLSFASGARGPRELSLGSAGRVVLAEGTQASATQDGCAITIELTEGALAAELSNLRPGSLRVRTKLGDVQVRGTTFSVDLEAGLQVVLLEGHVELLSQGEPTVSMVPGRTLRRGARREPAVVRESSAAEAQTVTSLLKGSRSVEAAPLHAPQELPEVNGAARPGLQLGKGRVADLLGQAEAARRSGDKSAARALYVQAERANHRDAEVALLRHAGFELEDSNATSTQQLLAEHRRRFPRSRFAAEAAWLEVRAQDGSGNRVAARHSAQDLVRRFPGTPQARAAQHLLDLP